MASGSLFEHFGVHSLKLSVWMLCDEKESIQMQHWAHQTSSQSLSRGKEVTESQLCFRGTHTLEDVWPLNMTSRGKWSTDQGDQILWISLQHHQIVFLGLFLSQSVLYTVRKAQKSRGFNTTAEMILEQRMSTCWALCLSAVLHRIFQLHIVFTLEQHLNLHLNINSKWLI